MSCMHRFQSNSTQEASSNNSWYKISNWTVARYLFGSLRQNVHLIHIRLRMRMVRCQTLRIYCTQDSLHRLYRRFLAITGIKPQYIRTLRTDHGGEYINHLMQALLNEHTTNHVVCAKDEHYSVGAAETAVNNLRHSARAMMLHGM